MGKRGPKRQQRVSGTGYTAGEATQLLYKRQATDGTYEIDVDAIGDVVDAYIAQRTDNPGTVLSIPGYRKALGIGAGRRAIHPDTYRLWRDGYVNGDHRGAEDYLPNIELSEAIRAGETEIAIYLLETQTKYGETMRVRQAETLGEIAPSKQIQDINLGGKVDLGRWGKWVR